MSIFTPKVSTALKSLDIRIAEKGARKELVYRSQQLPTDVNVSQDIQASMRLQFLIKIRIILESLCELCTSQ